MIMPYLLIKFGMHAFMKNDNDYFEPESVAASNWNRKLVPRQTDEWDFTGNHKHWINRGQLPGNGIWNDLIALVMLSAYILQHLLQGGRYKTKCTLTNYQMRKNGGSLTFNFMTYKVSQLRTGLAICYLLLCASLECCSSSSDFLSTANTLNSSTFLYYSTAAYSFVCDMCPLCLACWLWHRQSCTLYWGLPCLDILILLRQIWRGAHDE